MVKLDARVLNKTLRHTLKDGFTHRSSRRLTAEWGDVSLFAVQRIWRERGLMRHRPERHLVADDPDFDIKAAHVIGPHLGPPGFAAAPVWT